MIPTFITNKLLNAPDTRLQAIHWLESQEIKNKNIIKIANHMEHIQFNSTLESIIEQRSLEISSISAIDRYKLKFDKFRDNKKQYHVINLHKFRNKLIGINKKIPFYEYLIQNRYNYVFINYWDKKQLTLFHQKLRKNVKIIKKFQPTNSSSLNITRLISRELVKHFPNHFLKFNSFGPYIEVYKFNIQ